MITPLPNSAALVATRYRVSSKPRYTSPTVPVLQPFLRPHDQRRRVVVFNFLKNGSFSRIRQQLASSRILENRLGSTPGRRYQYTFRRYLCSLVGEALVSHAAWLQVQTAFHFTTPTYGWIKS